MSFSTNANYNRETRDFNTSRTQEKGRPQMNMSPGTVRNHCKPIKTTGNHREHQETVIELSMQCGKSLPVYRS